MPRRAPSCLLFSVLGVAVFVAGPADGQVVQRKSAPVPVLRPAGTGDFRVARWASLGEQKTGPLGRGLDLQVQESVSDVEEIVVFGHRHAHARDTESARDDALTWGPVTFGSAASDRRGVSGLTMTAAVALGGIPGLDAVFGLGGGHNQVNETTTKAEAAATAGLRWRF